MAEPFFSDLRIGVKCVFLAYKASEDMPLKLVKITSLNSDTSWENSVNTNEPIDDVQQTFFNTRSRAIYGIVTEKHRSMLTVLTGNDESISVDLDTVKNNCNCIIVVGDMLIMSCKVQSDATHIDFNGEILQIETIAFQRHKVETNYVTKVFDSGALLGGDCIHYYKSYEEKMQRGDVVDFEAVESEQTVPSIGILSWRVISIIKIRKIVDATANARKVEVVAEVSTDGFLKWDPIQIQWNFNEVREIQQQKLTITNNSKDKTYNLIKYSVFNKNCVKFAENQQIEGKYFASYCTRYSKNPKKHVQNC